MVVDEKRGLCLLACLGRKEKRKLFLFLLLFSPPPSLPLPPARLGTVLV